MPIAAKVRSSLPLRRARSVAAAPAFIDGPPAPAGAQAGRIGASGRPRLRSVFSSTALRSMVSSSSVGNLEVPVGAQQRSGALPSIGVERWQRPRPPLETDEARGRAPRHVDDGELQAMRSAQLAKFERELRALRNANFAGRAADFHAAAEEVRAFCSSPSSEDAWSGAPPRMEMTLRAAAAEPAPLPASQHWLRPGPTSRAPRDVLLAGGLLRPSATASQYGAASLWNAEVCGGLRACLGLAP